MSTLKVNNITDTSGGSSNLSVPGTAKAWVNFNGSGTVAIRDDLNVSSITDSGTGNYAVNITNALSNANYAVTSNASHKDGVYLAWPALRDRDQSTRSTTRFDIDCLNSSGAFTDGEELHIAVFAD